MSGFLEFLRCLLCCADEPDCIRSSSHYTRNHFQIDTADEEAPFVASRYYTSSPRLSHFPTSTSFQPHYHSGDFGSSLLRSPNSPPAPSYKPPPASQHFPSYTISSTIKPSSSFPKKPPQSSSLSSPKVPPVYKSILSPASSSSSSNVTTQHQRDGKKTACVCVEEDSLPVFMIPEDIKALIKDESAQ